MDCPNIITAGLQPVRQADRLADIGVYLEPGSDHVRTYGLGVHADQEPCRLIEAFGEPAENVRSWLRSLGSYPDPIPATTTIEHSEETWRVCVVPVESTSESPGWHWYARLSATLPSGVPGRIERYESPEYSPGPLIIPGFTDGVEIDMSTLRASVPRNLYHHPLPCSQFPLAVIELLQIRGYDLTVVRDRPGVPRTFDDRETGPAYSTLAESMAWLNEGAYLIGRHANDYNFVYGHTDGYSPDVRLTPQGRDRLGPIYRLLNAIAAQALAHNIPVYAAGNEWLRYCIDDTQRTRPLGDLSEGDSGVAVFGPGFSSVLDDTSNVLTLSVGGRQGEYDQLFVGQGPAVHTEGGPFTGNAPSGTAFEFYPPYPG